MGCATRRAALVSAFAVVMASAPIPVGLTSPASALGSGGSLLPQTALDAVSCVSAGSCTAVGSIGHGSLMTRDGAGAYHLIAANYRPVVVTESAGVWGSAAYPNAPVGSLYTGISCPSAGYCTAVGYDYSSSWSAHGSQLLGHPIYATETAGTWGHVTSITAAGGIGFSDVSCVAAAECTAVGTNAITGPTTVGPVVMTETGGTWGPVTVLTTPTGPGFFYGVSCTAATSCTAVGQDDTIDESFGVFNQNEPIYATESAGTWGSPTEISTPANTTGAFGSVSCVSATDCTAVGGDNANAIAATESAGVWSKASTLATPQVYGISCTTATDCTAVGGDGTRNLVMSEAAGVWGPASTDGPGSFSGDSCTATTDCTAVGSFSMCTAACQGPSEYPLFVTETAGVWPPVPSAPKISRVTAGNRSVKVAWLAATSNAGAPITGYSASATTTIHGKRHETLCASTGSSCTITGLTNARTYTVSVYARNGAGNSVGSSTKKAVPHAPR